MEFTNEIQQNPAIKEEKTLKNWDFATAKGAFRSSHNLTITDKRIILTDYTSYKNGHTLSRRELKNKDISGISVSTSHQNFIMLGVLCALFAVVMVVLAIVLETTALLIGTAVFGLLALYFFLKGKSSLTLTIYTNTRNNDAMGLYASAGLVLKSRDTKLKVKVNKEIAEDIVNNIGYYLLLD